MGRKREPVPALDIAALRASFELRDGQIIRSSTGEVATFALNGRLLVRAYSGGRIRRVVASKLAWILSCAELPIGPILPRNGNPHDFRPENLIVTRHGRDPFGAISGKHAAGGKASSLGYRAKATTTLINALADHAGATVPQLSRLIGSSTSCTCTRLGKLSDMGLTCGPKCDARARWDLTPAGKALAASAVPLMIDDLDREILTACARSPSRLMKIDAEVGVCRLTARRRIDRLVEAKLVMRQADLRYAITATGISALGDAASQRPAPWVRPELISAANARDVRERSPTDDRTRAMRSQQATLAAATMRLKRYPAFNRLEGGGVPNRLWRHGTTTDMLTSHQVSE
jgi:hypothetical protein